MKTQHLLFISLVLPGILPAQNDQTWGRAWLSARNGFDWVTDGTGDRLLLVGGHDGNSFLGDTWAWDGNEWSTCPRAMTPPGRRGHAAACDTTRRRVVLFGGDDGVGRLNDTWVFTGTRWMPTAPTSAPTGRRGPLLCDHRGSRQVVLFGGDDGSAQLADTWAWDGANWTQLAPANTPPARADAGGAYDSARDRFVMFGGRDGGTLSDTWEWDGSDWIQTAPTNVPPGRYDFCLAYDPLLDRTLMFGGSDGSAKLGDTWEWNGTDWTQLVPTTSPAPRSGHRMAFLASRGTVVLFGGNDGAYDQTDLWEWAGTDWVQISPAEAPAPRQYPIMAYDSTRDRLVMHGGRYSQTLYFNDTWAWDENGWQQLFPSTNPTVAREDLDMAYDPVRDRMVMFGGHDMPVNFLNETWEFDGTNWIQRFPATIPGARIHQAMAYDPIRRETVMFGGIVDGNPRVAIGETWVWNGTDWTQKAPANSPSPRGVHDMVWDPVSQKVLLFGGTDNVSTTYADLWEWDGTDWSQIWYPGTGAPARRADHRMEFDARRNRMLLVGGLDRTGHTYEWDGAYWTTMNPVTDTTIDNSFVLAHHVGTGRTIGFGGRDTNFAVLGHTWEYRFDKIGTACSFGVGCQGTSGVAKMGIVTGPPVIGQLFAVDAGPVLPGTFAFALFGWSQVEDGPKTLPYDLALTGMPGCLQLVSLYEALPPNQVMPKPLWSFAIPNSSIWLDVAFYLQAVAFDPGVNLLGAVTSDAIEATIGS